MTVYPPYNRSLFYWYVESQSSPSTDPLFWWSNGGPGCSGLMGFLTEQGPFRALPNGSLAFNPYAWNTRVNMLFVEAPAGVGFSFSNNKTDYWLPGDDSTARDNRAALDLFLDRFPHLRNVQLFISTESYGGHYGPGLSALLLQQPSAFPNFAGTFVGNPATDIIEGLVYGQGATLCGHAVVSRPTCVDFHQHCIANFSLLACPLPLVKVLLEAGALDRYGLDYPTCPVGVSARGRRVRGEQQLLHALLFGADMPSPRQMDDPCAGTSATCARRAV